MKLSSIRMRDSASSQRIALHSQISPNHHCNKEEKAKSIGEKRGKARIMPSRERMNPSRKRIKPMSKSLKPT